MKFVWLLKTPAKAKIKTLLSVDAELKAISSQDGIPLYGVFGGAGYFINGSLLGVSWGQSVVGAIPLYHLETKDGVYISDNLKDLYLQCKMRRMPKSSIVLCQAGETYFYTAKTKKVKSVKVDKLRYKETLDISLDLAAEQTLDKLVKAAEAYKGKKVVTTISGGTDGILTALAFKLAGVEQHCVCLGVDENQFDPKYAKQYAKYLDLDYTFLPIPTDKEVLQGLLVQCLKAIEMTEYSNVLMGICNTIVAEFAKSVEADIVFCADMADVVLGNDLQSAGRFKKTYPEALHTAANWAEFRIVTQFKVMPNNIQIYKAFNSLGVQCSQLWYNQPVLDFILSLPLECTPISRAKLLYYKILEAYLPNPSWDGTGKKVGYYTGTGIGKVRLEGGVLSDENIRATYKAIFKDYQ